MNLRDKIFKSPFRRSYYSADVPVADGHFDNYFSEILTEKMKGYQTGVNTSLTEILPYIVPEFQRDNDKWTRDMQISFVENWIMGLQTHFCLYSLDTDIEELGYARCYVLDGLQRLTSIADFKEEKFTIFDGVSYSDLAAVLRYRRALELKIRIYSFNTHSEAAEFYIAMNRNITHSAEDIARAEKYLAGIS